MSEASFDFACFIIFSFILPKTVCKTLIRPSYIHVVDKSLQSRPTPIHELPNFGGMRHLSIWGGFYAIALTRADSNFGHCIEIIIILCCRRSLSHFSLLSKTG